MDWNNLTVNARKTDSLWSSQEHSAVSAGAAHVSPCLACMSVNLGKPLMTKLYTKEVLSCSLISQSQPLSWTVDGTHTVLTCLSEHALNESHD